MKQIFKLLVAIASVVATSVSAQCGSIETTLSNQWVSHSYQGVLDHTAWDGEQATMYMSWLETGQPVPNQGWCDCFEENYILGNTIFNGDSSCSLDTIINPADTTIGCPLPRVVFTRNYSPSWSSGGGFPLTLLFNAPEPYVVLVDSIIQVPSISGGVSSVNIPVYSSTSVSIIDTVTGCAWQEAIFPRVVVNLHREIIDCDSVKIVTTVQNAMGPLSYLWSTGETTPSIVVEDGVFPTYHFVQVTDSLLGTAIHNYSAGGLLTDGYIDWYLNPFVLNDSISQPTCSNDTLLSNGLIICPAFGRAEGYVFSWSTGDIDTVYSNSLVKVDTLSGLLAGTYSVDICDIMGCVCITKTFTLETQGVPAGHLEVGMNNCEVALDIDINDNTSGHTYLWSTGDTSSVAIIQYMDTLFETVLVTAPTGCTLRDTFNINNEPLSLEIAVEGAIACDYETAGTINIASEGGYAPYQFFIDSTLTSFGSWNTYIDTGMHEISVEDSIGCLLVIDSVYVPFYPLMDVEATSTTVSCPGENTGVMNVTITNGRPPFTVNVIHRTPIGDTTIVLITDTNSSVFTFGDMPSGTYDVLVTDFNGCVKGAYGLYLVEAPIINLGIDTGTGIHCYGDSVLATSSVAWNTSAQIIWNTQDTSSHAWLTAGSHTVMAIDVHGCIETQSITITQPDSLEPGVIVTDPACASMEGNVLITPSSGVPFPLSVPGYGYYLASIYELGAPVMGWSSLTVAYGEQLYEGTYVIRVRDECGVYTDTVDLTAEHPDTELIFVENDTLIQMFNDTVRYQSIEVLTDTLTNYIAVDSIVYMIDSITTHTSSVITEIYDDYVCGVFQNQTLGNIDTVILGSVLSIDTVLTLSFLDTICKYTDSLFISSFSYTDLVDSGTVVETVVDSTLYEYFTVYDTVISYTHISYWEDWQQIDSTRYGYVCGLLDTSWVIAHDYLLSSYNIIDSTWSSRWSDTIYKEAVSVDTATTTIREAEFVEISIYPNPAQNRVTLSFSQDGIYGVTLYGIEGKMLEQRRIDGRVAVFELYDVPSGVYCVYISDGNQSKVVKILKK